MELMKNALDIAIIGRMIVFTVAHTVLFMKPPLYLPVRSNDEDDGSYRLFMRCILCPRNH
jgi:hypothetical protein